MKFTSDLLYRWVRAQGSGDARPDEGEIEVPTLLVPVVQVPGPVGGTPATSNVPTQRESLVLGSLVTQAASQAAAETSLILLGRGLWRLQTHVRFSADFTGPPADVGGALGFRHPSLGVTQRVVHFQFLANLSQQVFVDFTLMVSADDFVVLVVIGATGAAQTASMAVGGLVSRLN